MGIMQDCASRHLLIEKVSWKELMTFSSESDPVTYRGTVLPFEAIAFFKSHLRKEYVCPTIFSTSHRFSTALTYVEKHRVENKCPTAICPVVFVLHFTKRNFAKCEIQVTEETFAEKEWYVRPPGVFRVLNLFRNGRSLSDEPAVSDAELVDGRLLEIHLSLSGIASVKDDFPVNPWN